MSPITENARVSKTAPISPEQSSLSPLQDVLISCLQEMHSAEQQIASALPALQQKATHPALREGLGKHLGETTMHIERLEKALQLVGAASGTKTCKVMETLLQEGNAQIEQTPAGSTLRDVVLVLSAQKVEHQEIASYGGLMQLAKMLGHNDIVGLLDASLKEEYGADKLLTLVAESGLNYNAASGQ
ncbi:MAG: ferritin-like domain-containing protein [Sphingobacteriales bacterium]|nr:MAG: ferritin-like domain-containing protein [Sphingobacteriales bacterium]